MAAASEKEEAVELVEEEGRRLVDGNEHRLSGVGELAEETEDVERGLAVKTGGGLVEEEEDRLGDKLDTDGDALALLDTETDVVLADESILDVVKLKEVDDGVDICDLLRLRNVAGLAKKGRENERLADGLCRLVNVHLGDVACER